MGSRLRVVRSECVVLRYFEGCELADCKIANYFVG